MNKPIDVDALNCNHTWKIAPGGWGVIIGVSRCTKCDKIAKVTDFGPAPRLPDPDC